MAGPVETDESLFGGRESNKHHSQRLHAGREPIGKTAVVGIKDRATRRVSAAVVPADTSGETLKGFIRAHVAPNATVYTDGESGSVGLRHHEAVRHSIAEYVRGQAHVNGMENFRAMLKRGYTGTYHHIPPEHLSRTATSCSRPVLFVPLLPERNGVFHQRPRFAIAPAMSWSGM